MDEQITKNYNSFLHEELLMKSNNTNFSAKDLMGQSTSIIRQYLIDSVPIRQTLIKKFY